MSLTRGLALEIANQLGGAMPGVVTTRDWSRFHNDGAITTMTWTQLPTGLWVMVFDGADSRVNCGTDLSIANIFDQGGTVMAWINPAGVGEGNEGRVFEKWAGWMLNVITLVGVAVRLRLRQDFTTTSGIWVTSIQDIPLNSYTFVAVTYNCDAVGNDPTFYINDLVRTVGVGLTESSTPVGTRRDDSAITLNIGNNAAASRTFDGTIVLPRLYNYILTPAQIRAIYHSDKWLFGVAS